MKRTPRAPSSTVGKSPSSAAELAARLLRADRLEDAEVDVGERLEVALRVARAGCASPSAPTPTGSRCRAAGAGPGRSPARARAGSDPPGASASEPSVPCTGCAGCSRCRSRSATRPAARARRRRAAAARPRRRPAAGPRRRSRGRRRRCVTCRPVIVAARFSACEPMSPIAPAMPDRAGSVRHSACLLPVASSRVASQPWLYCDHDLAQLAELAARDHVARVADERVARVVVGDAEDAARALRRGRRARCACSRRVHERLVADDVEAGLDERLRDREVHVVGRHDRRRSRCGRPPAARSSPSSISCHEPYARSSSRGRDRAPTRAPASDRTRARPAARTACWSSAQAARCTAPMNAFRPPPTMP